MSFVEINQGLSTSAFMDFQIQAFKDTTADLEPLPEDLQLWLGRLRLLYGVPFEYLVPEERMLPKESIRFFYLDRNWLDRLVDGALAIGKVATRDFLHHEQKIDALRQGMLVAEASTRKVLRGIKNIDLTSLEVGGTMTGVLIRSTIVADFPGMEVRAYSKSSDNAEGQEVDKLPLLRMDRLAPDILFCIFQGVPKHLEVEEPREGIQFGVEEDEGGEHILLRRGTGPYIHADASGAPTDDTPRVDIPFVEDEMRVIDVHQLATRIAEQEDVEGEDKASSSDLALQLLQFPYLQMFDGDGKCADGDDEMFRSPFHNKMTFRLFNDELAPGMREVNRETEGEISTLVQTALATISIDPIFKG